MLRKGEMPEAEGPEGQAGGVPAGAGEEVPRQRQDTFLRGGRQEEQVSVRVAGLRKEYGALVALDGVSFGAASGSIFA